MYVKIFAGILDSSIASDTALRRFFMDLLLIADQDGNVLATKDSIALRLRVPMSEVEWGIAKLMEPDAQSGNPDHEGARLEAIEGRGYGWRILNYAFYRDIKTSADMRAANARRQAEFRARKSGKSVAHAESNAASQLRNESNPSSSDSSSDSASKAKKEKRSSTRAKQITFKQWEESQPSDVDLIPADHVAFKYAAAAGIPHDFVLIAWQAFSDKYRSSDKKYASWPAVFANAVKGNWMHCWYAKPDGSYVLTTQGIQTQRVFQQQEQHA